jgi:Fur family peroxide stress response transcriptional regulator
MADPQRWQLARDLARRLGQREGSSAPAGRTVFEALIRAPSHPTFGQILQHLGPRISSPELAEEILHELWRAGFVAQIEDPRAGTRYDLRTGPHYHFRCESCGAFSDLPVESFVLQDKAGHEIHELSVVAEGICSTCRKRAPLASASLPSLRILTGYLAVSDAEGLEAACLLPRGGAAEPACRRCFLALAAVLQRPVLRAALDRLLELRLADEAVPFVAKSLSSLAETLAARPDDWPRETLLALLWSVCRRDESHYRKLEERIAAAVQRNAEWKL